MRAYACGCARRIACVSPLSRPLGPFFRIRHPRACFKGFSSTLVVPIGFPSVLHFMRVCSFVQVDKYISQARFLVPTPPPLLAHVVSRLRNYGRVFGTQQSHQRDRGEGRGLSTREDGGGGGALTRVWLVSLTSCLSPELESRPKFMDPDCRRSAQTARRGAVDLVRRAVDKPHEVPMDPNGLAEK